MRSGEPQQCGLHGWSDASRQVADMFAVEVDGHSVRIVGVVRLRDKNPDERTTWLSAEAHGKNRIRVEGLACNRHLGRSRQPLASTVRAVSGGLARLLALRERTASASL